MVVMLMRKTNLKKTTNKVKIKLKLTPDTVIALAKLLAYPPSLFPVQKTVEQKLLLSYTYELSDKLTNKSRKLLRSVDLFNTKKKTSLTLKYHEAWALEQLIRKLLNLEENKLSRTLLQKTADDINQKLL